MPGRSCAGRLVAGRDRGVVLNADDDGGGLGARLKFTREGVRAINRWEAEGGTAGEDDVW